MSSNIHFLVIVSNNYYLYSKKSNNDDDFICSSVNIIKKKFMTEIILSYDNILETSYGYIKENCIVYKAKETLEHLLKHVDRTSIYGPYSYYDILCILYNVSRSNWYCSVIDDYKYREHKLYIRPENASIGKRYFINKEGNKIDVTGNEKLNGCRYIITNDFNKCKDYFKKFYSNHILDDRNKHECQTYYENYIEKEKNKCLKEYKKNCCEICERKNIPITNFDTCSLYPNKTDDDNIEYYLEDWK